MAEEQATTTTTTTTTEATTQAAAPQDTGRARDASGRFTAAAAEPEPSLLDWRATMPDDIRGEPVLQQYKTIADAAKALVHANRLIGRSIQIPDKALAEDVEGWNKVFDKLGRPADPNKYELTYPDLPDGVTWDPEYQRMFHERAHAAGLTKAQAQEMANLWHQVNVANQNRIMAEEAEGETRAKRALFEKYGANAPRLQQEAGLLFDMLARGAFAGDAAQRFYAKAIEQHWDNDPDFVALMSSIYKQIGEGEFYDGAMAPAGQSTPEGMRARARELSAKERAGTITDDEKAEKQRIYNRLAEAQTRQGRTALSGAPML